MLFAPDIVLREPLKVLAVTAIIMIGKTVAAIALVMAFRYPLNTALTVGASLAQIGEFSFILAGLGLSLGLLPLEGQSLILAGALISISLNPLLFVLFAAVEPVQSWVRARSGPSRRVEQRAPGLGGPDRAGRSCAAGGLRPCRPTNRRYAGRAVDSIRGCGAKS